MSSPQRATNRCPLWLHRPIEPARSVRRGRVRSPWQTDRRSAQMQSQTFRMAPPIAERRQQSLAYRRSDGINAQPMNAKKLHEKVAVITGASKGLGKAMALALAEAGAKLALVSRNLEQLKETAAAVRKFGTD